MKNNYQFQNTERINKSIFIVRNILGEECYRFTMCHKICDNATELCITVNEDDWCYVSHAYSLIKKHFFDDFSRKVLSLLLLIQVHLVEHVFQS
jgi:hypothetical protein